jgi:hypothetical protein
MRRRVKIALRIPHTALGGCAQHPPPFSYPRARDDPDAAARAFLD